MLPAEGLIARRSSPSRFGTSTLDRLTIVMLPPNPRLRWLVPAFAALHFGAMMTTGALALFAIDQFVGDVHMQPPLLAVHQMLRMPADLMNTREWTSDVRMLVAIGNSALWGLVLGIAADTATRSWCMGRELAVGAAITAASPSGEVGHLLPRLASTSEPSAAFTGRDESPCNSTSETAMGCRS
jgi:hypothetical protein